MVQRLPPSTQWGHFSQGPRSPSMKLITYVHLMRSLEFLDLELLISRMFPWHDFICIMFQCPFVQIELVSKKYLLLSPGLNFCSLCFELTPSGFESLEEIVCDFCCLSLESMLHGLDQGLCCLSLDLDPEAKLSMKVLPHVCSFLTEVWAPHIQGAFLQSLHQVP